MSNSTAEEVANLARLWEQGVLTRKEFDRQKRSVLRSAGAVRPRPSATWAMGGTFLALLVVAALFAALRPDTAGSSTQSPKTVQLENSDASASQVQTAIGTAMSHVGKNYDAGLCLQFVSEAWASAGVSIGGLFSSDDPVTYWANNYGGWAKHPSTHVYNSPPTGALVFWGANPWNSEGHVALSLGDNTVVSTAAYPYAQGNNSNPDVFTFALSQRSPVTYNYLGYVMPLQASTTTSPAPPAAASTGANSASQLQPAGGSSQLQPAAGPGALQQPSGAPAQPSHNPTPPATRSAPTVTLAQGPPAPAGYRYAIAVSNFTANTPVSITCYDSASPAGFYTFSLQTNTSGAASTQNQCYSGDGPNHWIIAGGVSSNTVTWSAPSTTAPQATPPATPAQPAPPAPAPTPAPANPTYPETVGGVSHTWTNPYDAGGNEGPSIPAYNTVQIACRLPGFKVADGDTWWYRITQSPWNDQYYVSADAFYNNGQTSGSLTGTPFVDPDVPTC